MRGYSFVEALVYLALFGVISLILLTLFRGSYMLKTSVSTLYDQEVKAITFAKFLRNEVSKSPFVKCLPSCNFSSDSASATYVILKFYPNEKEILKEVAGEWNVPFPDSALTPDSLFVAIKVRLELLPERGRRKIFVPHFLGPEACEKEDQNEEGSNYNIERRCLSRLAKEVGYSAPLGTYKALEGRQAWFLVFLKSRGKYKELDVKSLSEVKQILKDYYANRKHRKEVVARALLMPGKYSGLSIPYLSFSIRKGKFGNPSGRISLTPENLFIVIKLFPKPGNTSPELVRTFTVFTPLVK